MITKCEIVFHYSAKVISFCVQCISLLLSIKPEKLSWFCLSTENSYPYCYLEYELLRTRFLFLFIGNHMISCSLLR